MILKERFRKYLPVVVDIETGGFNPLNNAILEIAITLIEEIDGQLEVGDTYRHHIEPYEGLAVEKESLEFTKIDLNHPLRIAISEKEALTDLFKIINKARNKYECSRENLVGHNAHFDSSFINESVKRNGIKKSTFHPLINIREDWPNRLSMHFIMRAQIAHPAHLTCHCAMHLTTMANCIQYSDRTCLKVMFGVTSLKG